MRQVWLGALLFCLGLFADFFVEHTVKRAPEWVARFIAALFIPFGVVVVLISDLVWPQVYGMKASPTTSTAIIALAGAMVTGSLWWFLVASRKSPAAPTVAVAPSPSPQPAGAQSTGFREKVETVTFTLGGMSVRYGAEELQHMAKTPFNFGGYVPFMVRPSDNAVGYRLRVAVWSGDERPPLVIDDETFALQLPPDWDRNFAANAVEVIDAKGTPVFQMIRRSPGHVVVNGVFPKPDGSLLVAWDGKTVNGTASVPREYAPRPVFRYPSWKHLGVYAD